MNSMKNNNAIVLVGTVVTEKAFSHDVFGESFYKFDIAVRRDSGVLDVLPVIISERLCDLDTINTGSRVKINGMIRSYNLHTDDGKAHLILSVFVNDIIVDYESDSDANEIIISGFICKKPIYRQTPLGRDITDILLAVNRAYSKSDYLPCIAWGRNAIWMERCEIGTLVKVVGRFQSREYVKKIDENHSETRYAYEVSIAKLQVAPEHDLLMI